MHPLHDSPPNSPTVRPVGDNPNYEPPRVANPPRKLAIPKYRRSSFFRKRPKTLRRSTMPSPGQASDHSAESDWDDESPSHSQSRLMNSPATPVTSHPLPFSATTMVNIPFTKVNSRDYNRPQSTAEGWSKLAKTLVRYDETKIQDYKEDMDTLLVFAGLFSAVVTAFLIQILPALSLDPIEITNDLLTQISTQLVSFVVSNGFINSTRTNGQVVDSTFSVSSNAFYTNLLWFSSLFLSLITASLAMLVKQWLREYMAMGYLDPQSCARVRYFRYRGLVQWRVFQIAEALPLLLQMSLILFFAGLSYFVRSHNEMIGWIITSFIVVWIVIYQATFTAPLFSANCPYKTPLFRSMFRWLRRALWFLYANDAEVDEDYIRRDPDADYAVLASADGTFVDTEVLEVIRECLSGADGDAVLKCMRRVLSQRGYNGGELGPCALGSLRGESSREKLTLVRTMLEAVDRDVEKQMAESNGNTSMLKKRDWMPELLNCSIPQADDMMGAEVYSYVFKWLQYGGELAQVVLVAISKTESTSTIRRLLLSPVDQAVHQNVLDAAEQLKHSSDGVLKIDLCRVVLCFILCDPHDTFRERVDPLIEELSKPLQNPTSVDDLRHYDRSAKDCRRLQMKYDRLPKIPAPVNRKPTA